MTTKTVAASSNIFEKIVQFGVRLLECQKYFDVKTFYAAFMEAMLACATSCFPTMDAIDADDTPSYEQKKVKLYIQFKCVSLNYMHTCKLQ